MAVGRPISLTPNIATKSLSSTATADQTSFTVTGGYRINELGVYRNGVRLVQGKDFTANDGSTVTLLSGATVDDIIDFQIFDSFNIADALNSVGNQSIEGSLTATEFFGDGSTLSGVGTANINSNNIQVSGITTLGTTSTLVGSAVTFDASGGTIVGVVTATSFSGDGSALTGVANTDYIDAASITSSGIVSVTNTTASTSTSTGALIVSGGVGIAGSMFVGENVSIGGTLTYEDVTNIDSVGVVTARLGVVATAGRGVEITAGGLNVTAGIATFKNEVDADGGVDIAGGLKVTGVTTASSNVYLQKADAANLYIGSTNAGGAAIYLDGDSNGDWSGSDYSLIRHDSDGNLILQANSPGDADCYIKLGSAGHYGAKFKEGAESLLRYNNSTKIETTNDGTVTTGISTASDFVIGAGGTSVHTALGTKATTGKAIAMAMVFG